MCVCARLCRGFQHVVVLFAACYYIIRSAFSRLTTTSLSLHAPPLLQHAYYLQYKNARPDYLKAIWQVANWRDAASRFEGAAKK